MFGSLLALPLVFIWKKTWLRSFCFEQLVRFSLELQFSIGLFLGRRSPGLPGIAFLFTYFWLLELPLVAVSGGCSPVVLIVVASLVAEHGL